MSVLREAAQQALEALKSCSGVPHWPALQPAITALRAALEQPEPRNQCGETCERAKLCATCARELQPDVPETDCGNMEPVAWRHLSGHIQGRNPNWSSDVATGYTREKGWIPLYTHPPRREWRGLTVGFIREAIDDNGLDWHNGWTVGDDSVNRYLNLARAIEAALKERNA